MTTYGICFTYNNYTTADTIRIQGAIGQRGITYICYGREVGENGTPHLQGYLQSSMKNFQRLQMAVGQCHMEAAKAESGPNEKEQQGIFGVPYTSIGYCMKDGDFWEGGVRKNIAAKTKGQRSDLDAIKKAIDNGDTYDTICEEHFNTATHCHRFIKERIQARDSTKQLDALRKEFDSFSPRPWQQELLNLLQDEPNDRAVHWIYSHAGNTGKSTMATFLAAMHGATVLTSGKKTDLVYICTQQMSKIMIFDLSRTSAPTEGKENWLDGIYSLAEDLKNGRLVNTKYESKTVCFPRPHVVFFANFPPDQSKMSEDRWRIKEI